MFKPLALILVASLAAAAANSALAEPAAPTPVVEPATAYADSESLPPVSAAISSGLVPAAEAGSFAAKDMAKATGTRTQAPRRVRKEYPNVMGMSLTTWMTSRPH